MEEFKLFAQPNVNSQSFNAGLWFFPLHSFGERNYCHNSIDHLGDWSYLPLMSRRSSTVYNDRHLLVKIFLVEHIRYCQNEKRNIAYNLNTYQGVSRNRRNLYENVMMRLFSLRNYEFFSTGIEKLEKRWLKCIRVGGTTYLLPGTTYNRCTCLPHALSATQRSDTGQLRYGWVSP